MGSFLDNQEWNLIKDVYAVSHQENWTALNNSDVIDHSPVNSALRAVSAVTCSLSIIGSVAIILSYVLIKDIRSKARELLVHLSIMNLTFSIANLTGIILPYDKYLLHQTSGSAHDNFKRVCEAQAFFAVYGTIGSILWTLGLAVYLYFRIVSRDARLTKRVVFVLYFVCYALPLYPSLWLLVRGHYGYPKSGDESGGWCTVLIGLGKTEQGHYDQELMLFMVNDIWILLTFITMVPIYLIIHCQVRAEIKGSRYETLLSSEKKHIAVLRADQKFLLVPLGFMALRSWDLVISISYVYSQLSAHDKHHYKALVYFEAIGDSGQGILDFIFFCILQKRVRQYTIDKIRQCWCCKKYFKLNNNNNCNEDIAESFTTSDTPSQMSSYNSDPSRSWYED